MSFNPNEHLIQLKSQQGPKDYLPVAWRLVWFREICPEGTIKTEMLHLDLDRECECETSVWNNDKRKYEKVVHHAKGIAIFKAIVTDGKGGESTGTKQENAASFSDWLEKAETGSIGRALAALGFGTQFTGDEFDEGKERLADSPVDRNSSSSTPPPKKEPAATAIVTREPTPISDGSAKQQQSKVTFARKRMTDPEWLGFCEFAEVHPLSQDWDNATIAKASKALDEFIPTPSMVAKLQEAIRRHGIATMKALGAPCTDEAILTLPFIDAIKHIDRIAMFWPINELATVLDPGFTKLKTIGGSTGSPIDTPLDIFVHGLENDKETGKKYTEAAENPCPEESKGS